MDIDPSFYEPEVRCDYEIPAEMKKVWAVELDLLSELLRVCKENDITIVANGGTALGAARHQGFIPWDDDIDMMMLRSEYNKLCAIGPTAFKDPYFFQTEYTDPGSRRRHAQLRNSRTTGILKSEVGKYAFNQGIFIDIFPLDNVVEDEALLAKQKKQAAKYREQARKYYWHTVGKDFIENNSLHTKLLNVWYGLKHAFYKENHPYRKYEEELSRYNDRPTTYVSQLMSNTFDNKNLFRRREYFDDIIELPFEMITIPMCREYVKMLDSRFGNWHEFVKGGSWHGGVIFDTEVPYTEYLKKFNTKK